MVKRAEPVCPSHDEFGSDGVPWQDIEDGRDVRLRHHVTTAEYAANLIAVQ